MAQKLARKNVINSNKLPRTSTIKFEDVRQNAELYNLKSKRRNKPHFWRTGFTIRFAADASYSMYNFREADCRKWAIFRKRNNCMLYRKTMEFGDLEWTGQKFWSKMPKGVS